MIASVNLFFRDLERLTMIIITFLFYFTPIIYPESMIPEKFRYLLNFNPVAPLIVSWRNLLLEGTVDPVMLVVSFAYAAVALVAGTLVYRKLSWKFAEIL
jgi:lipopolysaccharide transport system permease protein